MWVMFVDFFQVGCVKGGRFWALTPFFWFFLDFQQVTKPARRSGDGRDRFNEVVLTICVNSFKGPPPSPQTDPGLGAG